MLAAFRRLLGTAPPDDSPVKVILGLGNPGREYEDTRHNVGWWVLDHLADVWHFDSWRKDGETRIAAGMIGSWRVRLVKPLTFMNRSGAVLTPYLRRAFWTAASNLLVVVDDVALPVGTYRLRASGSAGGHNGLKSIEHAVKSQQYARLRIGIRPVDERRELGVLSDFVLSPFGKVEREETLALMPKLQDAAETWIGDGVAAAMNVHNR